MKGVEQTGERRHEKMTTVIDYFETAKALEIIDVWKEGNPTGWVTPKELYDPAFGHAPKKGKTIAWFDHGTVGMNTLEFWCTRGSINSGAYTLAKYLVPHDTTKYADGKVHDTRLVVFKMIPDWATCNHTGLCIGPPFSNTNSDGMEYESLQNGTHDISDMAYVKGALVFTHDAVLNKIKDYFRLAHGIAALPWTRRTDPWAGLFDIARSWTIVQAVRADKRIWDLWGLPQPQRGL